MGDRVTRATLDFRAVRLNKQTRRLPNAGYRIIGAAGGYALVRDTGRGGAEGITAGYVPAAECLRQIEVYATGFEHGQTAGRADILQYTPGGNS